MWCLSSQGVQGITATWITTVLTSTEYCTRIRSSRLRAWLATEQLRTDGTEPGYLFVHHNILTNDANSSSWGRTFVLLLPCASVRGSKCSPGVLQGVKIDNGNEQLVQNKKYSSTCTHQIEFYHFFGYTSKYIAQQSNLT